MRRALMAPLKRLRSSSEIQSNVLKNRRIVGRDSRAFASEVSWNTFKREPVVAIPAESDGRHKPVPPKIPRPPYARTGAVPYSRLTEEILLHNDETASIMRDAARLAANTLELACRLAKPGVSTDEIDTAVHEAIIAAGAYPSPLNYSGFPKSLCSSVNEIICHGIPDGRVLRLGDVVSFDVSCFLNGVHGDNCATVIVGDYDDVNEFETGKGALLTPTYGNDSIDWRGVPYKTKFDSVEEEAHFLAARRLVRASRESVYAGIAASKPGGCLSDIGAAIEEVADEYGYSSVRKYRGHGVSHIFHCAPFVKHYRNDDKCELRPGMIFTIEPMLTEGNGDCFEWDDDWTVSTTDGGMSAQFEHTIYIKEDGVEILTLAD